jgi:hypothetical protein
MGPCSLRFLISDLMDHVTLLEKYPQVHVLNLSQQMKALMTYIREAQCDREDFVFYADRIVRFVVEEGLATLPCKLSVRWRICTDADAGRLAGQGRHPNGCRV